MTISIIGQAGTFATIQAAVAAAANGDTIVVDAGIYAENLTIDKAVTILGANAGIAGTATRGAETIIQGTTTVSALGPVTIDGIEVLNSSNSGTPVHWRERPHRRRCHHREQRLLLDWSQWHQ